MNIKNRLSKLESAKVSTKEKTIMLYTDDTTTKNITGKIFAVEELQQNFNIINYVLDR
jgi:pyrimidine operon attenuation protein/uracil phosphoribosyltransferase